MKKRTEELTAAYFDGYQRMPDMDDRDFIEIEQVGLADMPAADDDEWEQIYSGG